jgi:D-alanine-D-alanine ligase
MTHHQDIRRVGVILGGRSSEREVSLASGRQVYMNLDRARWAGLPLFMDGGGRLWALPEKLVYQNTCADIESRLASDAERVAWESLPERVDLVFIALHGKYGDDGCIQGALELLDLPYTGSGVLACALAQDKPMAHAVLEEAGLGAPRERVVTRAAFAADPLAVQAALVDEPGLPLVVLPAREGSSIGVSVVREAEALPTALATAFEWDDRALIEEFLDGMEFSVIVLEDEAGHPAPLLPTETVTESPFLTYDDKYMPGRSQKITPARVDEATLARIQDAAAAVFRALGFRGYARLDGFLLPDGRLLFTDPNPTSGMSPSSFLFHQAAEAGMTAGMVVDRILDAALRAHAHKRGPL